MAEVIRSFDCKWCGEEVIVTDPTDKRTVFCSDYCNRKYWKHPSKYRNDPSFDPDSVHGQKSKQKSELVRFAVYFKYDDLEMLRRKAKETEQTVSALVREAIHLYKNFDDWLAKQAELEEGRPQEQDI